MHTSDNDRVIYVIEYSRRGYSQACFKIGLTVDFAKRRRQHERGHGGLKGWLRTVSTKTAQVTRAQAGIVEHIWTLLYIAAYGFLRVRGAQYDSPNMNGPDGAGATFRSLYGVHKQWVRRAYQETATCLQRCYVCHGSHQKRQCPQGSIQPGDLDRFLATGLDSYDRPVLDVCVGAVTACPRVRAKGVDRMRRMLAWTLNA